MPTWPQGWKRTARPTPAKFARQTIAGATHAVLAELKRLEARDVRVDHDLQLRRDGLPYSDQKQPDDRGVVVYFTTKTGRKIAMPCDRWERVEHNLWAIAKTLEAKRGIERWGTATQEAEYEGYVALPPGDASQSFGTAKVTPPFNARQVLGVREDASLDACEGAYRAQAKHAHPDKPGGSAERLQLLNRAIAEIRRGTA